MTWVFHAQIRRFFVELMVTQRMKTLKDFRTRNFNVAFFLNLKPQINCLHLNFRAKFSFAYFYAKH